MDTMQQTDKKMKGKKVLYATSNDVSFRIANALFTGKCTLMRAVDGIEAEKKIKEEKPDIMITDLLLPGKNGYDVAKLIEEDVTKILISSLDKTQIDKLEDAEIGKKMENVFNSVMYLSNINFHQDFKAIVDEYLNK